MADTIEAAAAEFVAGELDKSDDAAVASTSADLSPLNGGGGTVNSLNYAPGTAPMGGGWDGLHDGSGTVPMPASYNTPTDNEDYLSRLRAEVRASEAETKKSLRRHAIGFVESPGTIAGIVELKYERAK